MSPITYRLIIIPVLLALTLGLSLSQPVQIAAGQAVLTWFYGDVQVRHGAGRYGPAKANEVLRPGDALKTGQAARAQLTIGRSQYVRMDQNSQLLITYLQADGLTSFKALVGGVWVTIGEALKGASKFEVLSPSVVAGVRGTVFRLEADEQGHSQVTVYEGQVEVTPLEGEQPREAERVIVAPGHHCQARRGLRPLIAPVDLETDEQRDWVVCNRQRDVLQHLGNPRVLVALTQGGQTRPEAAELTANVLVGELRQRGFVASVMSPEQLRQAQVRPDGTLQFGERLSDYYLVGKVVVQRQQAPAGLRLHQVRVRVEANLVRAGDDQALVRVEADAPATAAQPSEATRRAMTLLGRQLFAQIGPRLIGEVINDRDGMVLVALQGLSDPRQMLALREALAGAEGLSRVTLLPRQGARPALAVATGLTPDALAQVIRQRGGQLVEEVQAAGRGVTVRLRPQRP